MSKCCEPFEPSEMNLPNSEPGTSFSASPILPSAGRLLADKAAEAFYRIDNMDCPMEEALIRGKLSGWPGVVGLEFNLIKRVLLVRHNLDSLAELESALVSIGMAPILMTEVSQDEGDLAQPTPWFKLGLAGLLALAAEGVHFLSDGHWASLLLALAAIGLGGLHTYKKGFISFKNLSLNMNALMSLAVTGAILIGQWPEAAMVMVLFSVAEAIEAKSLARARAAIGNLLDLAPETATVMGNDGQWQEMRAEEVPVGRLVRVRPGERVALDGRIVSGRSALNQGPITGESLPVEKSENDLVFAGSINESGSFEFEVTEPYDQSTLARILKAVEEAQSKRAPIARLVDKFAQVYTPVVMGLALLVALLPPLFLGGAWLVWSYKALVLLVIACPCALVISTPVTIVSGLASAARQGILIKGGAFLEKGRQLKWIALDKTGTITKGRPELTDFLSWGSEGIEASRCQAASLAARSDHPVSRAIAEAAIQSGVELMEVLDFQALPGLGVSGTVGGENLYLASPKFIRQEGLSGDELEKRVGEFERQGKTVVGLIGPDGLRGLWAVADGLKEGSQKAISDLKSLGVKTMMLTGDNQAAAQAVASATGVDSFQAELLPQEKLEIVSGLKAQGPVAMVGDGINDAPALAAADIGLAMGAAGTGTAIETADVALMDDDLNKLPVFIRLSKKTYRILWQNISLALGLKGLFFVLTFWGLTTMWMAVFADIGVGLLVVANGLRMLQK